VSPGSSSAQSQLRRAVAGATPLLERISDADATAPRAPGKWSRKEIIDRPVTLDYFMQDYVTHVAHHLEQIFE
jgi:hypothetical protein